MPGRAHDVTAAASTRETDQRGPQREQSHDLAHATMPWTPLVGFCNSNEDRARPLNAISSHGDDLFLSRLRRSCVRRKTRREQRVA